MIKIVKKKLNKIFGNEKEYTEDEIKRLDFPSVLHYIKKRFTKSHLIISYDDTQRLRKVDGIDIKEIFYDSDKYIYKNINISININIIINIMFVNMN